MKYIHYVPWLKHNYLILGTLETVQKDPNLTRKLAERLTSDLLDTQQELKYAVSGEEPAASTYSQLLTTQDTFSRTTTTTSVQGMNGQNNGVESNMTGNAYAKGLEARAKEAAAAKKQEVPFYMKLCPCLAASNKPLPSALKLQKRGQNDYKEKLLK